METVKIIIIAIFKNLFGNMQRSGGAVLKM